jgi:hypothetical protein
MKTEELLNKFKVLEVTLMDNEPNPTMIKSNMLDKDVAKCAKIAIDFAIEQLNEFVKLNKEHGYFAGDNKKILLRKIQSLEKQKEELNK